MKRSFFVVVVDRSTDKETDNEPNDHHQTQKCQAVKYQLHTGFLSFPPVSYCDWKRPYGLPSTRQVVLFFGSVYK